MASVRCRSATKSAIRVCAMAARSMAAPMQDSRRAARADAYENPRAELQRHVPAGGRRRVDQAGFRVEAVERRIRYRRVGGAKETAAARLIARVPGPRAFLTYQHVLRARRPA